MAKNQTLDLIEGLAKYVGAMPKVDFTNAILRSALRILRHGNETCCPTIDYKGWANVESLVQSINCELRNERYWRNLQAEDLIQIAAQNENRLEVDFPRIRARYGHSLPGINPGVIAHPPEFLLHVTRRSKVESIQKIGLHPQGRNFVHLTSRHDYAAKIIDNAPHPDKGIALVVETAQLANSGLHFYQASDHVWLASQVSVSAISFNIEAQRAAGIEPVLRTLQPTVS